MVVKRKQPVTARVKRLKRAHPNEVESAERGAQPTGTKDGEPNSQLVYGEPPAWAEYRPDLCDALPWFRSLQGGLYFNGDLCWGVLVDADSGSMGFIDDEIIITRIGGGCEKDAQGNLVLLRDQDEYSNKGLAALTGSINTDTPVGLVLGDRNSLLGRKLPHRYNVMAYFRITYIWYERIGSKKGAKVRYEKLDLTEKSWWAAEGSPDPRSLSERDFQTKPQSLQCTACFEESYRIYNEGWMCLEPSCDQFFTINRVAPKGLSFHHAFLAWRSPPKNTIQPYYSLVPDLLSSLSDDYTDYLFSRVAWKGIVCPQCRRCISRKFWSGWKCSDSASNNHVSNSVVACTFEKRFNMRPVSLRSVIPDLEIGAVKRAILPDSKRLIQPTCEYTKHYIKLTYKIDNVGTIMHFAANKCVLTRQHGPNDLFQELQATDLGLRRYPLQQSVVTGTLTAHFAVNYGMPYKYVVAVDSKDFDEAPSVIMRALGRLSWATEQAVTAAGDTFQQPNELLTLGYFEDMSIGYHDDGESSLGPTIATLSLGGRALMKVRLKDKYFRGCTPSKKLLDEDPVIISSKKFEERKALKKSWENKEITTEEYNRHRSELTTGGGRREAAPAVILDIQHGDLIVMHGAGLQKYFEHCVIPSDKLRFALTARYIKPEEVAEKDHHKSVFSLGPDLRYDGQ